MSATLLGTVGKWGINSAETGLIVEAIDDTSKNKKSYVTDRFGCRTGRSDYDESIEITIRGKLTYASPWAQKLSANLTIANTISTGHLQTSETGRTLIDEVQRTRANEDWQGLVVTAELLPFFGASDPE